MSERDEALYEAAWVPLKGVAAYGVTADGEVLVSAHDVRRAILALRGPIRVEETLAHLGQVEA